MSQRLYGCLGWPHTHLRSDLMSCFIRSFYLVTTVMLVLTPRGCHAHEAAAHTVCSKHRSKLARNVLHAVRTADHHTYFYPLLPLLPTTNHALQYVFPHMQKTGVPSLQSCPFHPDNDVYVCKTHIRSAPSTQLGDA